VQPSIAWLREDLFESERQPKNEFAVADQCIYCGSPEAGRGIEHVFSDGLKGHLELPAGSCRACERKITAFEGRVLRDNFGLVRHALGLKSRKSGKKRRKEPHFAVKDSAGRHLDPIASIGRYQSVTVQSPGRRASVISGEEPGELVRCLGAMDPKEGIRSGNSVSLRFDTGDFPRFLAKTAHAYASAVLPGQFSPLLLDDIIARSRPNYSRLLGDIPRETPLPALNRLQIGIATGQFFMLPGIPSQQSIVIVRLDLFSHLHLPTFEAVTGVVGSVPLNSAKPYLPS
jgi:hypothetical protein